jgi:hypothetical protein
LAELWGNSYVACDSDVAKDLALPSTSGIVIGIGGQDAWFLAQLGD